MKLVFEEIPNSPPLQIAFLGYNVELTDRFLHEFMEINAAEVFVYSRAKHAVVMRDGTRIWAIRGIEERSLHGWRFDQFIIADDSRKMIYDHRAKEIEILRRQTVRSIVPPEFRELFYDVFAEQEGTVEGVDLHQREDQE
jgi:hypothetical protein